MNPQCFDLSNCNLMGGPARQFGTQENVSDLPVYNGEVNGLQSVVSKWKPTLRERLSLIFGGFVWLHVHGVKTHAPVALVVSNDYLKEDWS